LEKALIKSGISYAILRPAVLFGKESILINNISWMLRRFPIFGVFGDGNYRLQPIHVDDLAKLAVKQVKEKENGIIDAIGLETFTYRELVKNRQNYRQTKTYHINSLLSWLLHRKAHR
jgi:nucleoside-diphosphate-sugar epimerase